MPSHQDGDKEGSIDANTRQRAAATAVTASTGSRPSAPATTEAAPTPLTSTAATRKLSRAFA